MAKIAPFEIPLEKSICDEMEYVVMESIGHDPEKNVVCVQNKIYSKEE